MISTQKVFLLNIIIFIIFFEWLMNQCTVYQLYYVQLQLISFDNEFFSLNIVKYNIKFLYK